MIATSSDGYLDITEYHYVNSVTVRRVDINDQKNRHISNEFVDSKRLNEQSFLQWRLRFLLSNVICATKTATYRQRSRILL